MTDYVIKTENILTAPRNAGQTVDDVSIITIILKGLPRHFEAFSINVIHSNKELTFSEFKTEFHSFVETLKHRDHSSSDNVTKLISSFSKTMKNENRDLRHISCFTCGGKGHLTKICPNNYDKRRKPWYNYCKSTTHKRESCRYK